jgi:hypothetical protein
MPSTNIASNEPAVMINDSATIIESMIMMLSAPFLRVVY